jgi:hypothetical protein
VAGESYEERELDMGWIFFGFIVALLIEQFIRVAHNYERVEPRPQRKVQVSFPWYVNAAGAYGIYRGTHPKSKKGA